MLDLLLAVCCSLAIGMIFKHGGRQGMDRVGLLTANYAAAWGVATLFVLESRAAADANIGSMLLVLGGAAGALFILGFFLLSLATEVAGMSLATGVWRLSVVIPFLASWLIWNEVPSTAQGVGLVVAGAAFFMIAQKQESEEPASASWSDYPAGASIGRSGYVTGVLVLLFLVGGIVDVLMKAFDEGFEAASSRDVFLALVFGVAFSIGAGVVMWRGHRHGRWPAGRTVAWGLLLGLINYSSVVFILRAIRQLSGPFVFPANNIALVVGAALLGVLFWGERLTRKNWLGMGLAALALLLLSR